MRRFPAKESLGQRGGRAYGLLTDSTTDVDVGCGTSLVRRQSKGTYHSGGDGPIHMFTYLNAERTERDYVP